MGLILAIIIGVHWSLVTLKDSIFIQLVGFQYLPYIKTLSVFSLLPLVALYTKLVNRFSRNRMMVILPAFYGLMILGFSGLVALAQTSKEQIASSAFLLVESFGCIWYIFVESFSSIVITHFWVFAADVTEAVEAKRGFPLVYAMGLMGGCVFPYAICSLPNRMRLQTDAISLVALGVIIVLMIPLVICFLRVIPKSLIKTSEQKQKNDESSFFGDIKVVVKNRYLMGIFVIGFIYQVVITIFEFNFKIAAGTQYSGVMLSQYLSTFCSYVNIVSLICLLLGISNISRFFGICTALVAVPAIVGCAFFCFLSINNLSFLFALTVGAKAIHYTLNDTVLKQLYIPIPSEERFKGQAWIDTFGLRISQQFGSLFNMSLVPFQSTFGLVAGRSYYMLLSGCFVAPLIGLWMIVAVYLGRRSQIDFNAICNKYTQRT